MVFEIMKGFQTHHRRYNPKNLKNINSKIATNDKENSKVLHSHYSQVFNRVTPMDPSILDQIPQKQTNHKLGQTSTEKEIVNTIKWMRNNKALEMF